ncbi:DedA family protein [Lentilitoribacter sp. EG35]|uniref:DedA family protein n=1 Tax=Lentilitoribacter sp. EG35 TaxID=3234192 RepID=UPI003460F0CF
MTEYVLSLIPQYGLVVVFVVTVIACMGVPLPAAMLALASGGFAATGDLTLWHVVVVTLFSFVLGDQIAYFIARARGNRLIEWLRGKKRLEPVVKKGEDLLQSKGNLAIVLSRTIISPAGPWVSYICGATGFRWVPFALSAFIGASCWTTVYVFLGYLFAGNLSAVTDLISNMLGVVVAGLGVTVAIIWLYRSWRNQ